MRSECEYQKHAYEVQLRADILNTLFGKLKSSLPEHMTSTRSMRHVEYPSVRVKARGNSCRPNHRNSKLTSDGLILQENV